MKLFSLGGRKMDDSRCPILEGIEWSHLPHYERELLKFIAKSPNPRKEFFKREKEFSEPSYAKNLLGLIDGGETESQKIKASLIYKVRPAFLRKIKEVEKTFQGRYIRAPEEKRINY